MRLHDGLLANVASKPFSSSNVRRTVRAKRKDGTEFLAGIMVRSIQIMCVEELRRGNFSPVFFQPSCMQHPDFLGEYSSEDALGDAHDHAPGLATDTDNSKKCKWLLPSQTSGEDTPDQPSESFVHVFIKGDNHSKKTFVGGLRQDLDFEAFATFLAKKLGQECKVISSSGSHRVNGKQTGELTGPYELQLTGDVVEQVQKLLISENIAERMR